MAGKVLIVDDEPNVRKTMEMIHRNAGWRTASAESGAAALDLLADQAFDLIYLDLAMPDRRGIEVLKDIRLRLPGQMVVILTGQATIEKAVEATKLGAFDFLEKDCSKERILLTSKNALERGSLDRENRMLRGKMAERQRFLGKSKDHEEVLRQIAKVAPTDARVLIVGESGTGKELIAQEIHQRSHRAGKPFVKVNCAAIPEELIEAELFGSVKGAFTGSVVSREGKFQVADGGTILLDEVGDMSPRVQTKVLRAIQEGEIERVGSDKTITVDVRVLAATNKNLEEEIAAGRFREDLYFRLNVVPIVARPLRDHPEDIGLLAGVFIKSYCIENGLPEKRLDDRVVEALKRYRWPGNVRELRNQVERLAIMSPGRTVHVEDLSPELRSRKTAPPTEGPGSENPPVVSHESKIADGSLPLQEAKREFERRMILGSLERNAWNVTRAAGELGLERTALHKKIRALGLGKGGA